MTEHIVSSYMGLCSALILAFCSCSTEEQYPYEIPDDSKETYAFSCDDYCQAEAKCLSVEEDSDCSTICPSYISKGALQALYLDARDQCVESIEGSCGQRDLDDCMNSSLAKCQPASNLESLLEIWCSSWLQCNDAPVDKYLQRCLADLDANPDRIILSCLSAPAVVQFQACVRNADCIDIIDLPLLTLCAGVYR